MARLLTEQEYIERYVPESIFTTLFRAYKKKFPKIEATSDLPAIERSLFKTRYNIMLENYLNNPSIVNYYRREYTKERS